MKEGTDIIHELDLSRDRSTSLSVANGLVRRPSEQSGPLSPGLGGVHDVSGGGFPTTSNSKTAAAAAAKVAKSGASVQAKHHYRMIYDFHHTPKQPDLAPSLLAGAAGKVPPLNLMAASLSNGSGNSSGNFSPNRSVGMSMRRK